jgi:hypothetical protein
MSTKVNRKWLIRELDSLLKENIDRVYYLLGQKLREDDARVTFFKHINIVLSSAIISLIFVDRHLNTPDWLNCIRTEYSLSDRKGIRFRELNYYSQTTVNGTFIQIFNSFEHAIRRICEKYDNRLYESKKGSIGPLCKKFFSQLELNNKNKFIDLITYLRNSLHNNGLYMPLRDPENKEIEWNDTIFTFIVNEPIRSDLWRSLVPICREITGLFNEIISTKAIEEISEFPDHTESAGSA